MCVCVFLLAQWCLTLCDHMDCSLPGSSVHGISREEQWSGLPFPSPGDLPNPGIEPRSPVLQADSLPAEPQGKPLVCAENAVNSLVMLGQDFIPAVQTRIKKVHSEK